ncbi:MAG TPA: hypothetical protein VIX87_04945 [Steroidobacteraceae bacterium]
MPSEVSVDPVEQARGRLRRSRAEIVELAQQFRGEVAPSPESFPRSLIMRAATSAGARVLLGGATLSLALLRPGLFAIVNRLVPLTPLLRGAVNRYLVRRIFR